MPQWLATLLSALIFVAVVTVWFGSFALYRIWEPLAAVPIAILAIALCGSFKGNMTKRK